MIPHASLLAPSRARPLARAGFTLVEIMLAAAIGAVICAAGMAALVNLQKSYAATEQYATSLADQMRLVDYLSMDLRRATRVTPDADGNGVTLELPDFYFFNSEDPQFAAPLPNTPTVADNHSRARYGNASGPPRVSYHFNSANGTITREEVRANQAFSNQPPGQQPVASNVAAFPTIINDETGQPTTGADFLMKARITVTFHPMFQTPATPDSNKITLHNVTFLRNNDSRH